MLYTYRLEEVDEEKTKEIKNKKDKQREKEDEIWKQEDEKSNLPPPQKAKHPSDAGWY